METKTQADHGGSRTGAGRKPTPRTTALRVTRLKLGKNQEEMAALIGCTYNTYQLMERQKRLPTQKAQLDKFKKLAKEQTVPLDTQDEPPQPPRKKKLQI